MTNIIKVGLVSCLLVAMSGCYSKETNIEKNKGIGKIFATEIYSKQQDVKEKDFLSVCLYKVDKSDIRNEGNEAITFVTNECIKELRNIKRNLS